MKICPKCHIQVGGVSEVCPICQNGLEGESKQEYYWPPAKKLKTKSIFYKIQLLVVLTAVVITLGLDFLLDLRGTLHWSVIVALWGISAELVIYRSMKRWFIIPQLISRLIISAVILILITAKYANFWELAIAYIIPIIVLVALVTNFVLSMVDKKENAMVYLLCSVLGGILPCIGMLITRGKAPLLWNISIMLSVISVIGIAIFKGGKMLQEIRKRTNI